MCNPPLLDERTGKRASALERGGRCCSPTSSRADVRTICFARSRKGGRADLQVRAPSGSSDRRAGGRITPYRAGYTPEQRREIERRLVERRAARRGRDQRARARHRHRPPRRRDLGRPSRARSPACASSGAAPAGASGRAGDLRRRRGRARPVLLPPPRRVPGPAGRVGDPRPRLRDDLHAPPAGGRLRGAARARATPRPSATALPAVRRPAGVGRRAAQARRALHAARRPAFPPARVSLRSASTDASPSSTRATARSSARSRPSASSRPRIPGAIYLHLGDSYEVEQLDLDAPARAGQRGARRLLHAAEDRERDVHRGDARDARGARA